MIRPCLIHVAIWPRQIWAENCGAVPLWGMDSWVPITYSVARAEVYLHAKFRPDPSSHLIGHRLRQDRQTDGQTDTVDRHDSCLSICLSVRLSVLSETFVYCGRQDNGPIAYGKPGTPKYVSHRASAPGLRWTAGGAHIAPPDSLVGSGWGGHTILPPSALATKTRRPIGASVWRGHVPKCFPLEWRVMKHLISL